MTHAQCVAIHDRCPCCGTGTLFTGTIHTCPDCGWHGYPHCMPAHQDESSTKGDARQDDSPPVETPPSVAHGGSEPPYLNAWLAPEDRAQFH